MAEIIVKLGGNVVQKYIFDKEVISIGRARDNDIVIENLSVSRNHSRIRLKDDRYILTDLNSANGTYVNGVKVTRTELVNNDVITIGKHKLHFVDKPVSDEQVILDAFGADKTMLVEKASIAKLVILKGKHKEKDFPISKYETTIGRTADNDICLHDWFVSKKHAAIIRQGSNFFIKDLGSWKGTFVNEKQIRDTALNNNDTIQIGTIKFRFLTEEAEEMKGRVPLELPVDESFFGVPTSKKEQEITPPVEEVPTPVVTEKTEEEDILITDKEELPLKEEKEEAEVVQPSIIDSEEKEMPEIPVESPFEFPDSTPTFDYGLLGKEKESLKNDIFSDESASFEYLEEVNPPETPSPKMFTKEIFDETEEKVKKEYQFIGNKNDNIYHKTDCLKVNEIEEFDKVLLVDKASAELEGLKPCEVCLVEEKQPQEVKSEEEVDLWLSALKNKSPVIREHAKKRLKKLTGKDYD